MTVPSEAQIASRGWSSMPCAGFRQFFWLTDARGVTLWNGESADKEEVACLLADAELRLLADVLDDFVGALVALDVVLVVELPLLVVFGEFEWIVENFLLVFEAVLFVLDVGTAFSEVLVDLLPELDLLLALSVELLRRLEGSVAACLGSDEVVRCGLWSVDKEALVAVLEDTASLTPIWSTQSTARARSSLTDVGECILLCPRRVII
jgi:hypothetical protein